MKTDERNQTKETIIEYLRRFPFYKWAAKYAMISADTLENWRKDDKEFADRCEFARAEAIEKLGKRATPDYMLKCADPETFKERKEVDVTSNGESIVVVRYKDGNTTVPMAGSSTL